MKGKSVWRRVFAVWMIFALLLCQAGGAFAESEQDENLPKESVPVVESEATLTAEPTAAPTAEPTEKPTAAPTAEPTAEQTEKPAATPAAEATAAPTEVSGEESTAAPSTALTAELAGESETVPTDAPEETQPADPTSVPEGTQPADPTSVPEETQPADPTVAPEGTQPADPTDAPEETQPADPTDAPEETQPSDPTDAPEGTQPVEPTDAPDETQPADPTDAPEGETEETEFYQTVRIDGTLITVSAEKGVMEPGAELRIISTGDGDFTRAVEENLAEDDREILYLRHQVYQISGNEPNGTLQVKLENLGLTALQAEYPEGTVSASVWRFDPEGATAAQQARRLAVGVRMQENTVTFDTDRTGLYDVVTLVVVPSEPKTEDASEKEGVSEENDDQDEMKDPGETEQTEETDDSMEKENQDETADGEDAAESEPVYYEIVFEETVTLGGSADNDSLFEKYVQRELPHRITGVRLMAAAGAQAAGDKLSDGPTKQLYQKLAEQVCLVAEGSRASTVFTFTGTELKCDGYKTIDDLGFNSYYPEDYLDDNGEINTDARNMLLSVQKLTVADAIQALISDYPYDLFWMDQSKYTVEYTIGAAKTNNVVTAFSIQSCTVKLPVGTGYRANASDAYTFNTTLPTRVINANTRINQIVLEHEEQSEYQKVSSFKQAICNLVEYDPEAPAEDSDSWQLVNIFDGDPATKVNSNGYAKGFKYLCDLSGISCITVTGKVNILGSMVQKHMWNIVYMSDTKEHYLADLANCDTGRPGYPDKVFMKGGTIDPNNSNVIKCEYTVSGGKIIYDIPAGKNSIYDADWLEVSTVGYTGSTGYDGTVLYEIDIQAGELGTVEASPSAAKEGDEVTLTVTPLEGYELDTLTVKKDGTEVTVVPVNEDYTFTMPAGKVIVTATWKEKQDQASATIKGVSGSFNDKIKLNFYFEIPEEIRADEGAYVMLGTTKRLIKDAEYVEGSGYKFSLPMLPTESGNTICARIYDGNGELIGIKGDTGTDYTETGITQSLDQYMTWLAANGPANEQALASAAKDYCAAAKIYFNTNAEGARVDADLSGITASTLAAYKAVESGVMPEGINVEGCTLMIASDNTLRLYLSFNDVDPDTFTYTIDGAAATLNKSKDKEGNDVYYLATRSGIYSNKLQVNHIYGISDGEKNYSMKASVLTYAYAAVDSAQKPNLIQLGRALYRYNQTAVDRFGQ